jgi:HPt (histidine-containing phosphotransfer) domain-containing protein
MPESRLPNIDELRSRLGGNREAADSLLDMFAKTAPAQVEALRVAVAAADAKQAKYVAHSLKGSLLWIGANAAAEAARTVEAAFAEGGAGAPAEAVDHLATEVGLVVQAINER